MNESDYAHISNFTGTIERIPSNDPFYTSLVIRRRNNRRERHRIRINTIRVGRLLPIQNTNNPSLCHVEILIHIEYITPSHYALNKLIISFTII
ncbi:unnamed protein product [Rhizophagus irregularis]|uniref:Uncharacterized protein n=1 Tax=Rhizophagus irregularis TaxID=588596 RepID=A0A915YSX0_9GLOM|nr:unnamed protein product [Rhizophagus irregularis]CAB5199206.1 unnamed protein product [Rhizophagus irregularis]CAB5332256.1 unnamed protein product [Rhizophagus irregularis]